MSDYVFIRIKKADGSVRITDEKDADIRGDNVASPMQEQKPVKYIDQATWYQWNPTCVYHGGKLYCG
jgi:hypothetical protein